MYYHIRISQKSIKSRGEVKLDIDEEQLKKRYIEPYDNGQPIIINGKTILSDDIDRVKISQSTEPSSNLIRQIRADDSNSSVLIIGGPSDAWRAAGKANDVTDEFIMGAPGSKKTIDVTENTKIIDKSNKKVFIVHGHDHTLKNDLEVFCRDIGLEPIVLHRQIDGGLTIIEKFEQYANVAYAFILLTPDDICYSFTDANKNESDRSLFYRARQNVIFEFGYFVGKLGRSNICCIYKEGVELPSDLSGLIYKQVNSTIEEVGYAIIRELKAAKMDVNIK